jgi:hypothetical protein
MCRSWEQRTIIRCLRHASPMLRRATAVYSWAANGWEWWRGGWGLLIALLILLQPLEEKHPTITTIATVLWSRDEDPEVRQPCCTGNADSRGVRTEFRPDLLRSGRSNRFDNSKILTMLAVA